MAKETVDEREVVFNGAHLVGYGILAVIIIVFALMSFYTVQAGQRAVLLTFGNPNQQAQGEGLHFKVPIVQSAVIMSVQTQKYEVPKATAASKDLQTVITDVTVNYYINPDSVPVIYQKIGLNYQDNLIAPAIQEVVKASTADYTAEELITKRPEVKDKIDQALTDRLKAFNIIVQAVSITNFEFSPEFNNAIEAKVTAEQNALTEKNNLDVISYKAQQRIEQAKGEAEAIKIQAQAIQTQGGPAYVQLQAISKWDGKLPLVNGGGSLPFINLATNGANPLTNAALSNQTQ